MPRTPRASNGQNEKYRKTGQRRNGAKYRKRRHGEPPSSRQNPESKGTGRADARPSVRRDEPWKNNLRASSSTDARSFKVSRRRALSASWRARACRDARRSSKAPPPKRRSKRRVRAQAKCTSGSTRYPPQAWPRTSTPPSPKRSCKTPSWRTRPNASSPHRTRTARRTSPSSCPRP